MKGSRFEWGRRFRLPTDFARGFPNRDRKGAGAFWRQEAELP